jgi:hypothetical protein
MTTKHRFRNNKYRLQVREDDHLPPHVHLVGGSIDVRIDLDAELTVYGAWSKSLRDEVLAWVSAHQDLLMEEWKKWHP